MGCGSSKAEEPPLVVLCRERRELIRAAVEHRFALAAAHAAYFRALGRVGDALHRFVQEELVAAPASPVLTLPPSEGKGKAKAEIERSDREIAGGGAVGASASTFASLSHPHPHSHSDDSHLHLPSDTELDEIAGKSSELDVGGEDSSRSSSQYPYYGAPIPNYYYMKKTSTFSATTVYQNPYPQWTDTAYVGYGYEYGYSYPSYGAPTESLQPLPDQDQNFYGQSQTVREDKPADPPPPPPHEGSAWDFFNPFNSYEQMIPGYFQGGGSSASSPNSSEVREKEGIPDLEEETEQESIKAGDLTKRKLKKKDTGSRVSSERSSSRSSNVSSMEQEANLNNDTVSSKAKEENQGIAQASKVEGDEKEVFTKNRNVSFADETSPITEDSRSDALFIHGSRDLMDVVKDIKEQFESAARCSKEVSEMLEVGKLKYRSRNRILRVILSRMLDPVILPIQTQSQSSSTNSKHLTAARSRTTKNANLEGDFDPGKLSSTLDKLYVWEKKLHKIVQEEERLRIIYEREWNQLKALDENGAESSQVNSTRDLIRNLLTKLSIVIRSASHISKRIHKLRDEELRPQLIELIQGLVKMWRYVLDCHHKQFQAIMESRSHDLVARTGSSVTKATIELEAELLNWCSCFTDWISAQGTYLESLNGWLLKWIHQEREETPDGVAPFSPSRIGAPDAVIITNDWHHIVGVSVDEVIVSMRTFAVNVHKLWETQNEEQQQKLRAENLSKDFARRVKSLQKENGLSEQENELDKTVLPISNEALGHDNTMSLDAIKRRLDEETARHEETIKQVQQATASNLRMGLGPIFQALENFSLETLKRYQRVRISDD
ncbi:protein ROLLING AND ERECT LEAF 2-like [Zingiber officinale]|uniref:BZIP transcription factor n=1 Tax=Zingiber officinale TaxID=94328 RepID=A0A8J5L4A1_ZINOF|nr:protein ROLLING AND ERECT LEAF 2-like [Zingiber officinale]KAG6500426.1 hypothetical protein ZIOFF_040271 [Zingiber officinale]